MRSVLITGGTGSFGHAFTNRLLQTEVGRIRILSRCEVRQHEMANHYRDERRVRFLIGDVRDKDRLRRAMEDIEVVVHAAALKRVEACHANPEEAIATNIDGARNVIWAAKEAGVKKVIGLSTDKAFQPINIYGVTKAAAETAILGGNETRGNRGPRFSCTRYGNVWKSRGSVVPFWQGLLATGRREIPITDPECTRFFMRMDEAIDLVLSTIDKMPDRIAIPELPAYQLGDLADAMGIKRSWWKVTGLPAFEKKHESMSDEQCSKTARRMTVEELRAALNSSATLDTRTLSDLRRKAG